MATTPLSHERQEEVYQLMVQNDWVASSAASEENECVLRMLFFLDGINLLPTGRKKLGELAQSLHFYYRDKDESTDIGGVLMKFIDELPVKEASSKDEPITCKFIPSRGKNRGVQCSRPCKKGSSRCARHRSKQ